MSPDEKAEPVGIPEAARAVDFMVSRVKGLTYRPIEDLAEARKTPNAVVVLDGDWGGQVYATCPVKYLPSDVTHQQLEVLCRELSRLEWDQDDDWQVSYQIKEVGQGVWGGMGGGRVIDGLWAHPQLSEQSLKLLQEMYFKR